MIDGHVRGFLPKLTGPLIGFYQRYGLTPNQVTVLGFGFAVVAAVLVALGWTWPAVAVWWTSRLFDGTDGILARETGQVSDFGGYLDIVLDMAAYSLMILGFYAWKPALAGYWIGILIFYVLAITSALSLGALERERGDTADNRSLKLAAGLAEGGETGIAYTLMLLFPDRLGLILPLWIAVLAFTIAARTKLARAALR